MKMSASCMFLDRIHQHYGTKKSVTLTTNTKPSMDCKAIKSSNQFYSVNLSYISLILDQLGILTTVLYKIICIHIH